MTGSGAHTGWIRGLILTGAGLFIFALFVSAIYDPKIRVLHVLEALIYIAVIVLTRRSSAWGFGAGCIIAIFWNYIGLFVINFVKSGVQEFLLLLQTGHLHRPDLLIALPAAAGNFLLMLGCLAGFFRTSPKAKQWRQFALGGVLSVAYFVLIIVTTGRHYVGLLKRVFRL